MNNVLKLILKLALEHVQLNPYSIMKIHLVTQVIIESVSNILSDYYQDAAHATAEFCKFMDIFFDCLNARNHYEGNTENKEYLKTCREIDDATFVWLQYEFLRYLANWKKSTENRPAKKKFSKCSIEDVCTMAGI